MGGSQSSVESEEAVYSKVISLGDQIENTLTRELQDAVQSTTLNSGPIKEIYEKRSKQIIEQQKKFSGYKKLIIEIKTLSTTNISNLQSSLDECKRKTEKLTKDIKILEDASSRNLTHQKCLTDELAQKLKNEERKLKDETGLRQKAEGELLQMKIYKERCETYQRKIEKIEEELRETEKRLQDEVKLNIEQQFKQRNSESSDILRNTVESQIQTIEQLQQTQKEKNREFEKLTQTFKELQSTRNVLQRDVINKSSAIDFFKKEATEAAKQLESLRNAFAEERAVLKKQEEARQELEQKKQIENQTVSNKQNKQIATQNQQISRLKVTVKDLQILVKEYKDKAKEKETHFESMYQEIESLKEISNFLPKFQDDPEIQSLLEQFRSTAQIIVEVEKQKAQMQFKLSVLENSYRSMRHFCYKGLQETWNSLGQVKENLQESRQKLTDSEQSKKIVLLQESLETKYQEVANLQKQLELKEEELKNFPSKIYWNKRGAAVEILKKDIHSEDSKNVTHLEEMLERKTHEIAELKQQLKVKDEEMKKVQSKKYWNAKRGEMSELHEECRQIIRFIDDSHR